MRPRATPVIVMGFFMVFTTAAVAEIRLRDFADREVVLKAPATRIVALAPHLVENVFSAGAGASLVAVVSRSDYPVEARGIQRIGDYRSWSLEAVAGLQPNLVLLWGSGNGLQRLDALEALGIPVFVAEPRSLDDISQEIRSIGQMAGTQDVSEVEAARVEAAFSALRTQHEAKAVLSVFYEIWNDPLQTLNGEHLVSSIIELCGGRNVFSEQPFLAPRISLEAVLERDPDVIIASGEGESRPGWLDDWYAFPSLKAVRNEALIAVNPDYLQRATARLLQGAERVCKKLDQFRSSSR